MLLKGKVALVTGASRGIGAGIAIELAREGADLAITFMHNEAAAQKVVTQIQHWEYELSPSDVSDVSKHKNLIDQVLATYGHLDILINNAGVLGALPLGQITEPDFDRVFNTNAKAPLFLIQAAVPHIRSGGSIINISSVVTKTPIPAPYQTASKLALEGYAITLARDLAAKGIRINTVSAGYTETDMLKAGGPALLTMGAAALIYGRLGTVEDVARVVTFLADPIKAGWIVGQNISAAGGASLLP